MVSVISILILKVLCVVTSLPPSDGNPKSEVKFSGSDADFKQFLNTVFEQIQVNVNEKVQVKKNVYAKISNILNKVAKLDPCYNFRVEFKGSTYEGLKIGNPEEFDFGLVNDNWASKIALQVDGNTPAGFAYAVQIVKTCLDKFKIAGTKRLSATKVRDHLRDLVEKAMLDLGMKGEIVKRPWVGGPAVTFEMRWRRFPYISIDLAIGLNLPNWPPKPIIDPRPIGTNAKLQLVPKVKDESMHSATWQISTAQVEAQVINAMDGDGGCRKKVLQLAKFFKERSKGRWYPLATYHLKTILLHMNRDRKRSADWAQDMLVPRFRELIDRLLKHLRNGSLPNFFIPNNNLFEGKSDLSSALVGVSDFLKTLKANPRAFL